MVDNDLNDAQHNHIFVSYNSTSERKMWIVVIITATMMLVEIVGGWLFNSMAVYADGWHMSTHAVALGISGAAYAYSRKRVHDNRFAFGPWKVEALGGYTSAILLVLVALAMAWQSVLRIVHPLEIHYGQSLIIAAVGLAVNLGSAILLKGKSDDHNHNGHHSHQDLNLRAAYIHVIADATTSVGAIIALAVAGLLKFTLLDPIMGIVGSILICVWGYGLIKETSKVLVDREMDAEVAQEVRDVIESDGETRVADFHLWRVGRSAYACALVLETDGKKTVDEYRKRLNELQEIAHSTIEFSSRTMKKKNA